MTVTAATRPALRRLTSASVTFVSSDAAKAALGFAMSLVVGRGLGSVRFGQWTFCLAWIAGLTMISELGLSVLLTREAARPDRQRDLAELLSCALATRLVVFAPIGVLVYLTAGVLGMHAESSAGLRIGVPLAAAGAAYGCFAAVFRGSARWLSIMLWMETGGLAVQVLGSIWIVRSGGGIAALLTLATAVQLAQLAVGAVIWWFTVSPREAFAFPSWRASTRTIRRALPFAVSGLLANLQMRAAPLTLGYLSTQTELAWFGAASRLGGVAKIVPHALFGAALPSLSAERGTVDGRPRSLWRRFEPLLFGLTLVMAATLAVLAGPLLRMTYGSGFLPGVSPLVWVAIGLIPTLTNSGSRVYLYALGEEEYVVRWGAMGLVIQSVVGLALVPSLGASGAAASIALGEAVVWAPLRRRIRADEKGRGSYGDEMSSEQSADLRYARPSEF